MQTITNFLIWLTSITTLFSAYKKAMDTEKKLCNLEQSRLYV